jgi:hypothetical protein
MDNQKKKLSKRGCRLLAIAVIRSAISYAKDSNDYSFFFSELFHFYAGLAYGGKDDYKSDEDIVNAINNGKLEDDLRKLNGGKHSKYR